jgi:hypothetical protein
LIFLSVWSPLPIITWFLPFIGHTGIATSDGIVVRLKNYYQNIIISVHIKYDFAGPYSIGVGRMAFGAPTRYIQLDPSKCYFKNWDSCVDQGSEIYKGRMHNICCDNCHSHVAQCLNLMGYGKNKKKVKNKLTGIY